MRREELRVLHIAEARDEDALEALSRTAAVLTAVGVDQVLLVLDDGEARNRSWQAAVTPEVRLLRCAALPFVGKVRALQAELARLAQEKAPCAVHLHGVGPCLLAPQALKGATLQARILYSLHRRDVAAPWAATFLGRFLRSRLADLHCAPVAGSPNEAEALARLLNRSAEVLPQPVSDVFFTIARQEAERPTILADGADAIAVDLVTRLCVLLNGRDARIDFSWLGPAPAGALAQLLAAGIRVADAAAERVRAGHYARAWALLQLSPSDGVPRSVTQAMAAGVPCLVRDAPAHRMLIHHGETGFLCVSERDFLEKLVFLLRHRDERARIGEAARSEAGRRFTWRHFERAVLRAYGFSFADLAPAAGVERLSDIPMQSSRGPAAQKEATCRPLEY